MLASFHVVLSAVLVVAAHGLTTAVQPSEQTVVQSGTLGVSVAASLVDPRPLGAPTDASTVSAESRVPGVVAAGTRSKVARSQGGEVVPPQASSLHTIVFAVPVIAMVICMLAFSLLYTERGRQVAAFLGLLQQEAGWKSMVIPKYGHGGDATAWTNMALESPLVRSAMAAVGVCSSEDAKETEMQRPMAARQSETNGAPAFPEIAPCTSAQEPVILPESREILSSNDEQPLSCVAEESRTEETTTPSSEPAAQIAVEACTNVEVEPEVNSALLADFDLDASSSLLDDEPTSVPVASEEVKHSAAPIKCEFDLFSDDEDDI